MRGSTFQASVRVVDARGYGVHDEEVVLSRPVELGHLQARGHLVEVGRRALGHSVEDACGVAVGVAAGGGAGFGVVVVAGSKCDAQGSGED